MKQNKLPKVLFLAGLALLSTVVNFTTVSRFVFADEPESETSSGIDSEEPVENRPLSETQKSFLSQNCDSLKAGLKRLAVSDSKTRTYFGGIYETVFSKYITPLNLRLVKNNFSLPELTALQSSFADFRAKFSSDFISYSKSLEELTAFNCKADPPGFYDKLKTTREKRSSLKSDLESLNSLLETHLSLVKELKGSLNEQ